MGRLTVRLPDVLHRQLEALARGEGVSLNQYLVYALTRQATLDAHLKTGQEPPRQKPERQSRAAVTAPQGVENLVPLPGEDLPPPAVK
jgi:hypothetical protein